MIIRPATPQDAPAIMDIYNDAVLNTTAIWNDDPVDVQNRLDWMSTRRSQGYPVFVSTNEHGTVSGYASYGPWRAFDGFSQTAELSLYVHNDYRGQGIGRALLRHLIEAARAQGLHVLVAGIEAQNSASLGLHISLGFTETARMPQVGKKFGRWLDLVFLQKQLDIRETPEGP